MKTKQCMMTLKNVIRTTFFVTAMTILTLTASAIGPEGSAPKGTIKGIIADSLAKIPIEYASIALYRLPDSALVTGTISNASGRFEINAIPDGNYYLLINFMGFEKKRISPLTLEAGKRNLELPSISLKPTIAQLQGAEITAEKRNIEYRIDKKVINASQQITSAGGNALDLLRNTPSITVDMNDNVSLRGNQGFTLLIDGKPTVLQTTDALRQLPASSIDNIEIVTNPSANQEAQGNAGIINIILKKEKRIGIGGIVNLSVGTRGKESADASFSRQVNKFNFTGGVRYNHRNMPQTMTATRENYLADSTVFMNQDMDRGMDSRNAGLSFGFDWDYNPKSTFSTSFNYGGWSFKRDFDTRYDLYSNASTNHTYTYNRDRMEQKGNWYSGALSWKKTFDSKKHQLSSVFTISHVVGSINTNTDEFYTFSSGEIKNLLGKRNTDEDFHQTDWRFKLDYTRPFGANSMLETGIQLGTRPVFAITDYTLYDIPGQTWLKDTLYSHDLKFRHDVQAAYVTWAGKISELEYKVGLRGEYYYRYTWLREHDEKISMSQFDLFPSVHLSYKTKKEHQFQLSYSRRTNRPSSNMLFPSPDYSDAYTISKGNPYLKPEFTDSWELNYLKMIKKFYISLEMFHRITNDGFDQNISMDEKGTYYQTSTNTGKTWQSGAEASVNADLSNKWSMNISGSYYHNKVRTQLVSGPWESTSWDYNIRWNNTVMITKTTRFQTNFTYTGPTQEAQRKTDWMINISAAVRQDILKQKASLVLTVSDFLGDYNRYKLYMRDPRFKADVNLKPEWPIVMLTFSYRFNNYKRQKTAVEGSDMNIGGGI